MSNILVTCKEFYPDSSAIVVSLNPYLEELKKENTIFVVTRRTKKIKKKEEIDGYIIYRCYDVLQLINKENRFFIFLYKVYYRLFCMNEYDKFHIFREKLLVAKLIKRKKISIVISCSYPFDNQIVLKKIKDTTPSIKWIAIQFDPYTYNSTLFDGYIKQRLDLERKILIAADKIFLPVENYEQNIKNGFVCLKEQYRIFSYISPDNKFQNKSIKNNFLYVYTGRFYDNIREPDDLISFFENTALDFKLEIYYITESNIIEKKLKKFQNKFKKNQILLYTNKDKITCDEAINRANFIINVGNMTANQTPSKVYEIISTGKPVINLISIQNDTSLCVLSAYSLSISIFLKKGYDKQKCDQWMSDNCNIVLPYEIAMKDYNSKLDLLQSFKKEVLE